MASPETRLERVCYLNEITVPLDGVLDGVALHQEGVVPLAVDDFGHSVVVALHKHGIFLGLHKRLHSRKSWIFRILQNPNVKSLYF